MKIYILFGALFAALLATAIVIIELVRVPEMYAIEGHGTVKYRPDSAHITVGFLARSDSPAAASQQAAKGMGQILAALKTSGVQEADIATDRVESGIAEQPYNPPGSTPQRVPAFASVQAVQVTLHDLARIGKVLDTVSAAGANYWRVDYFTSDVEGFNRKARNAAFADAMQRADAYAGSGGFRRGRVLKIQEVAVNFPYTDYGSRQFIIGPENTSVTLAVQPPPLAEPAASRYPAAGFSVPPPEETTIDATVNVLFELK
jgi:uncharacterized protein YggE